MSKSFQEESGWIRHAKDGGLWWPGLYSGTHDENSLLVKGVRDFAHNRSTSLRSPDRPRSDSPVAKFESPAETGKVHLFWLPHNGSTVEATRCRKYTRIPTTEGADKCYEEEAKAQMDELIQLRPAGQDLNATAPLTPSSPLESAYSTANRETPSDVDSWVLCPSSGGNASQDSPALSVSSSATVLEASVTPLEPTAGFRVNAQASNTLAAGGNGPGREQGGEESVCSPQSGTKRPWVQTSHDHHHHHHQQQQRPQNREGAGFPGANVERTQGKSPRRACPTDLASRRLDGSPTPPGAIFRCTQGSKQDLADAGMETGRHDAHDGLFHVVTTGSTEESCEWHHQESSEESEAVDNVRAGGPKQPGAETLPAQQDMDVCEVDLAADAVASTDRDASTRPGEASPAPVMVALPRQSDQLCSGPTLLPADDAKEAAAFLEAGITGEEQFTPLSAKLKKLGWKWGGKISDLSNDVWFLKAGVKGKTAQAGVGKFERDDVVRYVRKILGVQVATTPDNESSEESSEAGSDSSEEGDDDLLDEEGRVEEERGTSEPSEGTPLTREEQALQAALEALHPSKAPGVMKQRAAEFERVLTFVVSSAKDPSGGSLYLCGCPGTGKTQTMAHVQAEVQRVAAKGKFPTPAFHAFTGTAFTDPNAMHSALWRAVTGGMDVPANIEKALSAKLKRRGKPTATSPMIVVVLDEIDQLISQNRQVLRKLFEWADAPKSRLVLVGIANSIEFDVGFSNLENPPEKVLFQAYTPEDLMSILTERVGQVVQKPAVQLCSKKVAATHGDARRAISLCREAVVLAKRELREKLDNAVQQEQESVGQQEGVALVTIQHMSVALAAGRVSRYTDAIAALSIQAQVVLSVAAATVYGVSSHGGDQFHGAKTGKCARLTQGDLHEKCMHVCGRLRTGGGMSQVEFSGTIDTLEAQGLLRLKGKQLSSGRARQLVLLVEFSDVEIALSRHPFFKAAVSI